MGGRGTYAVGNAVPYTYETVSKIDGVKVLQPIDKSKSFKLPEESHTSNNKYVLLDKDGVFRQYREYDSSHRVVLEIGYHFESGLGKGKILHVHLHTTPGVDGHDTASKFKISPGDKYYEKYKKLFVGVKA
jgi:hypothetical protein